jgi:hypothetical protein
MLDEIIWNFTRLQSDRNQFPQDPKSIPSLPPAPFSALEPFTAATTRPGQAGRFSFSHSKDFDILILKEQ